MFRLMFVLFGWILSSLLRPDDTPTDDSDDNADDDKPEDHEGKPQGFSQADVDRIVSERLERERKKQEKETENAKAKAKADALKDQEKYKELSEEQAGKLTEKDRRISELEEVEGERDSLKEQLEGLEKRFAKAIKDKLSVVPEPYQPLLEKMSVVERADWVEKNADKLSLHQNVGPKGSRPSPRATNSDGRDDARDEEARRAMEQRARAGF